MSQDNNFEPKPHSPKRENQNVRDSSIEAYQQHCDSGRKKKLETVVLLAIKEYDKPLTRKMLEGVTGLAPNFVSRYVNLLLSKGKILESKEKHPCKVTGSRVYYLKAIS